MLIIIGLLLLCIIVVIITTPNKSGYNCNAFGCILVDKDSQFTTKENCEKFCKKNTELTKSSVEPEPAISSYWRCDEINCTCVRDDNGPYTSYNECRYTCDNCMSPYLWRYYYPQTLYPKVHYGTRLPY